MFATTRTARRLLLGGGTLAAIPYTASFCDNSSAQSTGGRISSLERRVAALESLIGSQQQKRTIVGFGSLLSIASSRSTFPELENFRIGRVHGYKRLFQHPAGIFFERGIAVLDTKEMSSLSTEPCDGCSFTVSIFDINESEVPALEEREEEFDMIMVPFTDEFGTKGEGYMCTQSSDEKYLARWVSVHITLVTTHV